MSNPIPTGIDVLNAGLGHLEIRFNGDDPMEQVRASRIINDMLKRGYALFVEGEDGKMTRVKKFIESKFAYIIADGPDGSVPAHAERVNDPSVGKKSTAIKASSVKTTAVGRSAGG